MSKKGKRRGSGRRKREAAQMQQYANKLEEKLIPLICPSCGAPLKQKNDQQAYCPYCTVETLLDDSLEYNIVIELDDEGMDEVEQIGIGIWEGLKLVGQLFVILLFFSVIVCGAMVLDAALKQGDGQVAVSEPVNVVTRSMEEIFHKKYKKITQQELESVKYIHVRKGDLNSAYYVDYSFSDYEEAADLEEFEDTIEVCQVEIAAQVCTDYSDLTGLTYFCSSSLPEAVKLSEKAPITALCTSESLLLAADALAHPENVKNLVFEDGTTLDGIEKFTGLESFQCRSRQLADVQPLFSLKKLEELSLDYADLKTILFLDGMSQLKRLTIQSGDIEDFTPLKKVPQLEELSLYSLPDPALLSDMKHMKRLDIAYDFGWDTGSFPVFEELDELRLGFPGNRFQRDACERDISFLNRQPALKKLELYGSEDSIDIAFMDYIHGMAAVLNRGRLEELVMHRLCLAAEEQIQDNHTIKKLSMQEVRVDPDDAQTWSFIGRMKALEELSVKDCSLQNIDFLSGCQNLNSCRLECEGITDYSVLDRLPNLQQVPE